VRFDARMSRVCTPIMTEIWAIVRMVIKGRGMFVGLWMVVP
jgi:hypothetical protein